MPSAGADGDPVVLRWVLVGGDEDGVGLAGINVDVGSVKWLDVITVGFYHQQLVILKNNKKLLKK